jgi:putative two-component system hydrogenase maturation factor HypX/HoxX
MRVLLLAHAFNSLTQGLWVDLSAQGHAVSLELDIADAVTMEAVSLFEPDVVVASFLKRAIPEAVWRKVPCLVVHPGPPGDRGPSSLDWAILEGAREWGVTVLQANEVMDGGPEWASRIFPMREATKSSVYRNEVTDAAAEAVREALAKLEAKEAPRVQDAAQVKVRPLVRQAQRRIDWATDDVDTVLRSMRAADSTPGVLDEGNEVHWFRAFRASMGPTGPPGTLLGRDEAGAVLRATRDGAVWLTHAQPTKAPFDSPDARPFKRPAAEVVGATLPLVPEPSRADITAERVGDVTLLRFDFSNGAMSTSDCLRLRDAFVEATRHLTRVIVLLGGADFWSNGIHLNAIEAAASPADESMRNIEAMDEVCRAIIECTSHLTIGAMQGNAGAGGCFLALAADEVLARRGVILNPHYKNMGNLYGSEYWTYLLPRRVGEAEAKALTQGRLPLGADEAMRRGLVDGVLDGPPKAFVSTVSQRAQALAEAPDFAQRLEAKRARRADDEGKKPLAAYREAELKRMHLNFYGFDPSYHVARYHFVHRLPHAWTPLHLARHRSDAWKRQQKLVTRGT